MRTIQGRDVPVEGLTAENYKVPKGEERFFHAVIEVIQFDPKTGKKLSKPRVQKFGRKAWEGGVKANLLKQGYKITILHDPKDYDAKLAEQKAAAEAAKAEEAAKKAAEAKAALEAEEAAKKKAFDEAVAAEVERRLKEAKKKADKEAKEAAKSDTKEDAGK